MEIYVVKSGDNVDSIAGAYGVSVELIIYDNQLVYPYPLAVGQALLIDTGGIRENRREGGYKRVRISIYKQLCFRAKSPVIVGNGGFFLWIYKRRGGYISPNR